MHESQQSKFLQYIIRRKSKRELLDALQTHLHIKSGAAYKRISGDTAMTADEMVSLAHHFGFSLDTALGSEKFISFEHPFMKHDSSIDFLDRYSFYLKPLLANTGSSKLTYMANEIPIFYYFSHRYIFNFLLSIWNHLHWDEAALRVTENQAITPQLEYLRGEIASYYESHPVTEIWNSNMLSNLYQQILFSITIRAFDDLGFVKNLIVDIEKLIARLQQLAGTGLKSGKQSSNITIYLNEFGNYQNLALYESEKMSVSFVGFDMPHFIVSYNKGFHTFSQDWITKIRKRSLLISSEGYQFRELFFLKMNKDFVAFKDRLEKLIAVYYT